MHLKTLLAGLSLRSATADMETEITRISYDSRTTAPGDVFVAMTGFATDGHAYIGKAVAAGAAAVVCERPPEDSSVPYVLVENSRRALAVMAANYYGHPADSMTMVAVTGTNGKTTTTYLLKAILEQELGAKVGLIGTNQDLIGDEVVPTERTTPESLELQELFARMRSAGCTHVVMEASSHALALDRVYGIHYAVGIFTNLTQDHLDFHKTMEAYCDAKAILFQNCDVGVCNADDPWTERLLQNAACRQYFYAEHAAADLRAEHITLAADHIAFQIRKGEFVAIVGQSGSGKSTCMNIIGCLDVPTSGTYLLDGRDVGQMDKDQLAAIRNKMLGFIFQQYNLLPKLTLQENVEVPLMYAGIPKPERHERSRIALEMVGLGDKLRNKPSQLSGGQQQRASIARALAGDPAVILADEPTGALDSHTGREVLTMLQQLHAAGNTVVLITHDNSIAVQAQRIIRLEDGHVIYDGDAGAPEAVVTPNLAGRGMAG